MNVQIMIDRSIYSLYFYIAKKEKAVKALLFNIKTLDYHDREFFMRFFMRIWSNDLVVKACSKFDRILIFRGGW